MFGRGGTLDYGQVRDFLADGLRLSVLDVECCEVPITVAEVISRCWETVTSGYNNSRQLILQ